jgi:uncharacterized membrane protein YhaH (DUF805 family)
MTNVMEGLIAGSAVPPWLPRDAQDARKFAYWAQIIFLLMAFVWFVIGIALAAIGLSHGTGSNIGIGIFGIVMALVCGLSGLFLKKSVIDEIDHGRFHDAKANSVIWLIIGIAGFAFPTILLILVYMKLSEAISPQAPSYAPYAQGTVVAQAPQYQQPYQQPAQAAAPAAQQTAPPQQLYYQPAQAPAQTSAGQDHKYQMMKCKKCGVQFPAFMTNCPNCGSPK